MKRAEELFKYPGVVKIRHGTKVTGGIDTGKPAVVVAVKQKKDVSDLAVGEIIPSTFGGLPTDVIEESTIRALEDIPDSPPINPDRKKWYRPAFGGLSVGHRDISAGTLGCVVMRDGQRYILGNKHVLGNCNEGKIGDPIYQPGPHDGHMAQKHLLTYYRYGCRLQYVNTPSQCSISSILINRLNKLAEKLGRQTRFKAVVEYPINYTDWACGGPVTEEEVINYIPEIGEVHHVMLNPPYVGMPFKYTGRTSGYKTGAVTAVDVMIRVDMGDGNSAVFSDQIEFQPTPLPGDSGSSMIINSTDVTDNIMFGLLFAGSNQCGYANKCSHVWEEARLTWPSCSFVR